MWLFRTPSNDCLQYFKIEGECSCKVKGHVTDIVFLVIYPKSERWKRGDFDFSWCTCEKWHVEKRNFSCKENTFFHSKHFWHIKLLVAKSCKCPPPKKRTRLKLTLTLKLHPWPPNSSSHPLDMSIVPFIWLVMDRPMTSTWLCVYLAFVNFPKSMNHKIPCIFSKKSKKFPIFFRGEFMRREEKNALNPLCPDWITMGGKPLAHDSLLFDIK